MRSGDLKRLRSKAAGFSMVEMLITAFVLAVGILGLTMLQAMSLRAVGGSKKLTVAVQLTEQMMDQVELEGRLTYNNATIGTSFIAPESLVGLQYNGVANVNKYYSIEPATGNAVEVSESGNPLFYLTMTQTVVAGVGLSDVSVSTRFIDGVNEVTHVPINRTVTLTRRIRHA